MLKAKEFNRIKQHVHVVTRWRSRFAMCFIVWCYWWILIVLNFAWYYFIVIFAYFCFKNCYSVFCIQTTTAPNDAKSITPAQSTLYKRHGRAGWGERDGRVTWEAQRQNVQRKLTLIRGRPWNAGISLSTDRGKKRNAAFAQHQKSASAPTQTEEDSTATTEFRPLPKLSSTTKSGCFLLLLHCLPRDQTPCTWHTQSIHEGKSLLLGEKRKGILFMRQWRTIYTFGMVYTG